MVFQELLRESPRATAKLDDRPGFSESGVARQVAQGGILEEPLPILSGAQSVIEPARLVVREHNTLGAEVRLV